MSYQPTLEQQAILDAFPKHKTLKINAVAGSGKTSTLNMLANANEMSSLYVCFNKANATEAATKFPKHVACRTMHSLAYAEYGRKLQHKLAGKFVAGEPYVNKGRSNLEVAKLYGIPDLRTSEDTMITCRAIAGLVKLTVGRYQNSPNEQITEGLIPTAEVKDMQAAHPLLDIEKFKQIIINFANKLWNDRCDVNSPVQAEHDTYLKLWQLSSPTLNYEVIYVDEAQDTNPVCFDILKKQTHAKMVYVGDSYQSIYGFRQAVNAMEQIKAPMYVLSKSFRYGQKIADLATFIIKGAIDVKGLETLDSKVSYNLFEKYTMIFRTNAFLIGTAVTLIGQRKKVYCNIDTRKFENQLNSVQALHDGDLKNVKDDDIAIYSSWAEFCEVLEEVPEYKRLAAIVEEGLTYVYLRAVKQIKLNKDSYDILLTTGHKSKGMEWDNVVIADDFNPKWILVDKHSENYNQQEVNLFYVACTRAIKNLMIPAEFMTAFKEHDFEHTVEDTEDSKSNLLRLLDLKTEYREGLEDENENLTYPERVRKAELAIGNMKLVHIDAGTSADWSELRNTIGNPSLNKLVDQVEAGVGVRLTNGGLVFPDADLAEEELRARYSFGG